MDFLQSCILAVCYCNCQLDRLPLVPQVTASIPVQQDHMAQIPAPFANILNAQLHRIAWVFTTHRKNSPNTPPHFSKVCILYLLRSFTVARELLFRIVRWGLESNLRPTKTTVLTWVMVGHAAPGLQGVDVVVQGVGCFTSRLPLPTLQARQNTKMYLKNLKIKSLHN